MSSSNRKANTARKGGRRAASKKGGGTSLGTWLVFGVVGLIVAAAAIIGVVLATGGGDDKASDLPQTQPVTIEGEALPAFPDSGVDSAIGMAAPTFTGLSFDGTELGYEPGEPTLVIFLAHWCHVCQAEVPVLVEWQKDGNVPDWLDVLAVATATDESAANYPPASWLERERFPFPVMADNDTYDTATAFGLQSYPYFVLLDADGNVVSRTAGALEPEQLDAFIAQAAP